MPVHEYGTILGTAFNQSTDWTQFRIDSDDTFFSYAISIQDWIHTLI